MRKTRHHFGQGRPVLMRTAHTTTQYEVLVNRLRRILQVIFAVGRLYLTLERVPDRFVGTKLGAF